MVVVAGALLPALGPAAVGLARNQVAEASAATAAVVVEAALAVGSTASVEECVGICCWGREDCGGQEKPGDGDEGNSEGFGEHVGGYFWVE